MQPFTLKEGAMGVHEMYLSFRAAGFKWYEALYLIAHIIRDPTGDNKNGK